jgi:hypothetical protein
MDVVITRTFIELHPQFHSRRARRDKLRGNYVKKLSFLHNEPASESPGFRISKSRISNFSILDLGCAVGDVVGVMRASRLLLLTLCVF